MSDTAPAAVPAEVPPSAGTVPPLDPTGMSDRELLECAARDARQALAIATALAEAVNTLGPLAQQLAEGGPMGLMRLLTGRGA